MPSADFCTVIPAPRGAGSPDGQPCRSPRVLRTHFHAYACRIYVMAFCASIGFRRFRTAYPAMPPRIRFLFVRPAICLGLPSDSQSPAKPLPLASTSPCRVCGGLPPLSERALPGAPKKTPVSGGCVALEDEIPLQVLSRWLRCWLARVCGWRNSVWVLHRR